MAYIFTLGQADDEEETEKAQGVDYVGLLGTDNHLGQNTAVDLFKTVTGTIANTGLAVLEQSDTKIVFRSNVTPEITIDVPTLLKGEQAAQVDLFSNYGETSSGAITTDSNELAMKLLAPQISFQAKNLGLRKSVAPYGSPTPNAWIMFLFVLAASGLIGAKIAWTICTKIPAK